MSQVTIYTALVTVVTCFNDTLLTAQVLLLGLLLGAIVGRSSIWRPVPTLGTRIIGNVVTQCNPNTAGPYTFFKLWQSVASPDPIVRC